jgi:UDP-N-acetylglucosamine diphosphorylase/glucosamine-1-phosphate N-acetyltransferase
MRLCIYEDETYGNFYPLTYLRPIYELRCGIKLLREKIASSVSRAEVIYLMRNWLAPKYRNIYSEPVNDLSALKGDDILFVNGRYLHIEGQLPSVHEDTCLTKDGTPVISLVRRQTFEDWNAESLDDVLKGLTGLETREHDEMVLLSYFWDLIAHNPKGIRADFERFYTPQVGVALHPTTVIRGPKENIYIADDADIHPLVELDCSDGPIVLEKGTKVQGIARIEGPAAFGEKCIVMSGAKIREGCSFGNVCRVGGEIEESIFHGYSNKYHDGFIGHSYICEWVNLGALTTNSDLKNDYSKVSVYLNGTLVETDVQFLGSCIGDHSKLGIGTLLNTGSIVGIMCNVLSGGGPVAKYIPSFGWFLNNKLNKVPLKMQLDTATASMARRKLVLSEEEVELFKHIKDITKEERNRMVRKGTL